MKPETTLAALHAWHPTFEEQRAIIEEHRITELRKLYLRDDCWDDHNPKMVFNEKGKLAFEDITDEVHFKLKYL